MQRIPKYKTRSLLIHPQLYPKLFAHSNFPSSRDKEGDFSLFRNDRPSFALITIRRTFPYFLLSKKREGDNNGLIRPSRLLLTTFTLKFPAIVRKMRQDIFVEKTFPRSRLPEFCSEANRGRRPPSKTGISAQHFVSPR